MNNESETIFVVCSREDGNLEQGSASAVFAYSLFVARDFCHLIFCLTFACDCSIYSLRRSKHHFRNKFRATCCIIARFFFLLCSRTMSTSRRESVLREWAQVHPANRRNAECTRETIDIYSRGKWEKTVFLAPIDSEHTNTKPNDGMFRS